MVTRYETGMSYGAATMDKHESGDWVSYEDYQTLCSELAECRDLLSSLMAQRDPTAVKKAADWLADWDGKRIDPAC